MPRPDKPEPPRPGDEEIAREEVEGYYRERTERAAADLAKAQANFDRTKSEADASIAAFHAGGRLPDVDAWSIEIDAGSVHDIGHALLNSRSTDHAAYDRAKARRDATARWLRHEGYERP